jgi:hypothetical protein
MGLPAPPSWQAARRGKRVKRQPAHGKKPHAPRTFEATRSDGQFRNEFVMIES